MHNILFSVVLMTVVWAGTASPLRADNIDINFESQAVSATDFDFSTNSPLVIGSATFTGGELLTNQLDFIDAGVSADTTTVYATTSFGSPYANPLTISFSTPVSAFSVLITNEFGDSYTVADNLGGFVTAPIGPNTSQIFGLSDTGISSVTIGSASTANFQFAIDDVKFTTGASVVPEPNSVLPVLLASGITAFLARRFRVSA